MDGEFKQTIRGEAETFGVEITEGQAEELKRHYDLVLKANEFLHLTGPCTQAEFARRHTLESLILTRYLADNTRFIDIGAGGGLPSIPCLIVRPDLSAVLIESKEKKARFLADAAVSLSLNERVSIIASQFDEAGGVDAGYITSRALDRFSANLPKILKRFRGAKVRFFGGPNLEETLSKSRREFERVLIPGSEKRYLFVEKG